VRRRVSDFLDRLLVVHPPPPAPATRPALQADRIDSLRVLCG